MTLEHEPDPLRRIPTKHPGDIHAEIGATLKAARLKRGQSLDAVVQQTRISKRYLEALENDRFDEFPAVVYLRGFLKGYCEHLELDFAPIWAKLEPPPPPVESAAPAGDAPAAKAAPAPAAPAKPAHAPAAHAHAPAASHAAPHGESRAPAADALPAIVLSVLLAVGLAVWLLKDKGPAADSPAPQTPQALQPLPRAVEPKLTVTLLEDAWIEITVDGQPAFEGRAPRGAVQEWRPAKTVGLRTTDTRALSLSLNGSPLALPAPAPDGSYLVEIP